MEEGEFEKEENDEINYNQVIERDADDSESEEDIIASTIKKKKNKTP